MTLSGAATDLDALKARLERKATFEAGLRQLLELAEAPSSGGAAPADLLPAAARAHALLKARYSNPAWLRLGGRLFAALAASSDLAPGQAAKAAAWRADVQALLGEEGEPGDGPSSSGAASSAAAAAQRTLGELLGFAPPQAGGNGPSHLTDAGLNIDHPTSRGGSGGGAAAEELLRALGAAVAGAGGVGGGEGAAGGAGDASGGGSGGEQPASRSQPGSQQQQQQPGGGADDAASDEQGVPSIAVPQIDDLAGLQALLAQVLRHHGAATGGGAAGAADGAAAGGTGTAAGGDAAGNTAGATAAGAAGGGANPLGSMSAEDLLEELQIMMATLASEAGASAPRRPPASRRVVAALPVRKLDAAAAAAAGGTCPVCCEAWGAGDDQQALPCSHAFHPACLAPWLAQHNSCPMCRHELPTDDHAYEARKEREAEMEEERRGAANAHSHNEFMYI